MDNFIIFNLIMLIPLAAYDLKTCTAPKTATLFYVVVSLLFTTPINLIGAVIMALVMFAGMNYMWIGNADKKIFFGLALQSGFPFAGCIYVFCACAVYAIRRLGVKGTMPLIPVILVGYVFCLLM